jgi:hypothetical protein
MMSSSFVQVVIRAHRRLEKEHKSLRYRYIRDPLLKDMLDSMKDTIGYHDAWVSLQSQISKQCEFSGCLATVYAGTTRVTRVESEFSILGWERDRYRSALAKQFKAHVHRFCLLANDLTRSK